MTRGDRRRNARRELKAANTPITRKHAESAATGARASEPGCDYDRLVFSKRTRATRRRKAADWRQRQRPLDEIFQKDAKRTRRRHAWSTAAEIALAVVDMLP
jgi:hypothetical protein